MRESSGKYNTQRKNKDGSKSQYLGKYQMGNKALSDAGFKEKVSVDNYEWTEMARKDYNIRSDSDFLQNSHAQEVAIRLYHKSIYRQLKANGCLDYLGRTINGVVITESGLLSAGHLVGPKTLKGGLDAGDLSGKTYDINPHALTYLRDYGGYSIDEIK